MNVHKFAQHFDIAEVFAAKAYSVGTQTSTSIDLTKYTNAEIAVLVSVGAVGTGGELTVKFQESDDNSTFSDVTGDDAAVEFDDVGSALLVRRPRSFTKRYVRVAAVVATDAVSFAAVRIAQKADPAGL